MDAAVFHAQQKRAKRLLLGVYTGNTRARAFYENQGFVQISERQFRVGVRDYDDVVLAKVIT
jgi:ribosomal protein S18 acetylase RimI-like enzyme